MYFRSDNRLRRLLGGLAATLIALLVVQTPVAAADRMFHAMGQAHAANPLAGAVLVLHEHEVGHDSDHDEVYGADHADSVSDGPVDQDPDADADVAGPHHHHHHHDNASAHGLTMSPSMPVRWASSGSLFGAEDDLRAGLAPQLQDRPPKLLLAHVA